MFRGGLFTRFFLDDGVAGTPEWVALDGVRVDAFAARLRALLATFPTGSKPSEATTEQDLIFPVLAALGWEFLTQVAAGAGKERDKPDALLFASADAKARASARKKEPDRYPFALVVAEHKAWRIDLDRAGSGDGSAPASQMLRYLRSAEDLSEGAIRWGMLTNGRVWRLYSTRARSKAEGFLEIDLAAALGIFDAAPEATVEAREHALRLFLLFFGRDAFLPTGRDGRSFLDDALALGRRYEAQVTADLSRAVFEKVFPDLVRALARADPDAAPNNPAWRDAVKDSALILLYRLLFILYAEDRDLLPTGHAYALRFIRDEVAGRIDRAEPLPETLATWWPKLRALFAAIEGGEPALGLPPYNGGLFADAGAPLLSRLSLPDRTFADLLDALSRTESADARRYVNYRDLSVQQLGAIYEQLLEYEVTADEAGNVAIGPNPFARRTSGSYYTPEELVALAIRRAVGPLLREREDDFAARAVALGRDRRTKAERLADLRPHDPAGKFLDLKVCDPAMGSGHFLVSLVDYLADETLSAMAQAEATVAWADAAAPYRSPLAATISGIRAHIEAEAAAHGWKVAPAQLDDRHIVRRIILKRVIYGVDLNPMAVELAKLSLWLHSFTVGAPLSFLDHHLRCGDSLFGEWVFPVEEQVSARGGIFLAPSIVSARMAAKGMAQIEAQTDADIAEVKRSAETFADVEEATGPLARFLDVVQAAKWLAPLGDADASALAYLLDGVCGDPIRIAAGTMEPGGPPGTRAAVAGLLDWLRALAAERRFLHWEPAFPGVWDNWESAAPTGGFDAIIGNPPWDRIKLQEVEWFAARVPEIAREARAADRKRRVAALQRAGGPIADAYKRAAWTAEAMARMARHDGRLPVATGRQRPASRPAYPLLGGGDVNLYSLFVERGLRLLKPGGIVGLLTPSGIAADKGASAFFRAVSTTGRLGGLFDFENRRNRLDLPPFFPDVDSRFKFCALVVGGKGRTFPVAECAFFQDDAEAAEANAFPLAPADFVAVNPNTATAPVFRTRRDAELTTAIHRRVPVLVDRRSDPPAMVWPLRYCTMFHMTNDSDKFRTEAELVQAGAYRVAPNRWRKGRAEWVPLYEGKMVQAFDHRAASVVVNPENVHRPAQPRPATPEESADPASLPEPQFWVAGSAVSLPEGLDWYLGFKDVTAPTNVRTMIACAVPFAAFGNTLPVLLPDMPDEPTSRRSDAYRRWQDEAAAAMAEYHRLAPLLLANMNAFALDYVARQKVQGQHLNWYIVEQLPFLPLESFARRIGGTTAEALVRAEVLRLTYTATDMQNFAADMGHAGPPFPWNEEDRRHSRARLDALFFHLYGIERDDAGYILETFPSCANRTKPRSEHSAPATWCLAT